MDNATTPTIAAANAAAHAAGPGAADVLSVFLGLAFVLALIAGLAYVMRRFNGVGTGLSRDLRVRAGISVGTRERVLVIETRGRLWLIGVAAGGVSTLADLGEADAREVEPTKTPAFADLLRRVAGTGMQT